MEMLTFIFSQSRKADGS